MRRFLLYTCMLFGTITSTYSHQEITSVVVYGATASGCIAAIAAARSGVKVLLIEPGKNVGGMVTGGLSHNDYGDLTVIGGLAREFYEKVADHYQKPIYYWRGPEPGVGEMIFREWLEEAGVSLIFGNRVMEVANKDGVIQWIVLTNGDTIRGRVFVDASYEGDLMARAGVTYSIGREGISEYGESWAGRRAILPDGHQMLPRVSPFDEEGNLLPLINDVPLVKEGEADKAVQGYGFRLIVTDRDENRIPFSRPVGYDSTRYALIKKYYEVHPEAGNMVHLWPTLPNGKADMNSSGPISTNVVNGLNWEYPDADYERRDEIWQEMKAYTLGLLYFLSNDPSIPVHIREETSGMGFCRDEFTDNGYFPHQLYIRVARRMKGEYFMTQHDLGSDALKYDAIGMGSYNIDIRHVQRTYIPVSRFPELHYEVYNEGYLSIPVTPYQIPYRSLLPRYRECKNLLVSVCMSASFIANASIRMEPQYMIMGHAAGVAAAMASLENSSVHTIDMAELQSVLKAEGQVLSLADNPYGAFQSEREIIIDNNMRRFTRKSGPWQAVETEHNGRYRMNYALNNSREGTFGFIPWIREGGKYAISLWYPSSTAYSDQVRVQIHHLYGTEIQEVNQQQYGGRWTELGTFEIQGGRSEVITIVADSSSGPVTADAVRLVRLQEY
ncbi:MAG: FAD-dependent oxidoreductase [Bacteroidales bacterium]